MPSDCQQRVFDECESPIVQVPAHARCMMSRRGWIDAGIMVTGSPSELIRCPENDDDYLVITWIPSQTPGKGEFHLKCPTCGADNYVLVDKTL